MSSTDMFKDVLKEFVNNIRYIPNVLWRREILWLVNDKFGIRRNGNIVLQDKERKTYTLKTFLLKPRLQPCLEKEVIRIINEYLLFVKLRKGTLRAKEIMRCRNAEIRRMLLEGFGYEKFLAEVKGEVVHKDGDYRLIRIEWNKDEEPIKLVRVKDASTNRMYVLRVPPTVKTCKEAIAWTFGLSEDEYNPIKET